jgi:uncharacterized protein (TIGR03435 family)
LERWDTKTVEVSYMKKLVAVFLAAFAIFAQSKTKKLAFEVVSIKPTNAADNRPGMIGDPTGGRFITSNVHLRQLIVLAYGERPARGVPVNIQITGLPGWATTDGYDVQAQPEAGFTPTQQQTQEMLQSMLEDRFKLRIRRESKEAPIYALVVGKNGVKMKLSEDQTPFNPAGPGPGGPPSPGAAGAGRRGAGGPGSAPPAPGAGPMQMQMTGPIPRGMIFNGLGQLRAGAQTMALLAGLLTSQTGRKVVDKTGLTGLYDIELKWTTEQLNGAPPPGLETGTADATLFTAIQEQLGLRLAPDRGPVDTFVVESVQRPSEN